MQTLPDQKRPEIDEDLVSFHIRKEEERETLRIQKIYPMEGIPPSFGYRACMNEVEDNRGKRKLVTTRITYIRTVPLGPEEYTREEVLEMVRKHHCGVSEELSECIDCHEVKVCAFCTAGSCPTCRERRKRERKKRKRAEKLRRIHTIFGREWEPLAACQFPNMPAIPYPNTREELQCYLRVLREYREKNNIHSTRCSHKYTQDLCNCERDYLCRQCEERCIVCQTFLDAMAAVPTEYSDDPPKRQELERKKAEIRALMRSRNKGVTFKSDRVRKTEG